MLLFLYAGTCGVSDGSVFVPDPLEKTPPSMHGGSLPVSSSMCPPMRSAASDFHGATTCSAPTTLLATFQPDVRSQCFSRRDILKQFRSFIQLQVTQERPPPLPWKFFFSSSSLASGAVLNFRTHFRLRGLLSFKARFNGRMQISWDSGSVGVLSMIH